MSNIHTDDTFMYENKLVGGAEGGEDVDPLVWRITYQSGPPVSRRAAADALRGIDPDVLNEQAAEKQEHLNKMTRNAEELGLYDDCVDWTQAPDWATAWAMDDDGAAYWFKYEPTIYEDKYGAGWGDDVQGTVEEAPDFGFPASQFRNSLCTRSVDEKDETTLAEQMGDDDYTMNGDFKRALMDAFDKIDNVHSPSHYRYGNIECIEAIEEALTEEEMRGYFKGNCIKYLWRERHKNGAEDLQKAYYYLGRLIDNLED